MILPHSTPLARSTRWMLRAGLALGLAVSVSGCGSADKFNPFTEKEKKLSGARQPVFPEGVPGVEYGAPRAQPTNTNAQIDALPPAAGIGGR
ncbi:hypothetical protein ACT6QH_06865 [Xanthobacter sp. TB0139]|uniref:hypothetical protein n=1 Tax=Xanthobacter sp. TB0139 TaxID=3459178 RepID=UPI004039F4AD